MPLVNEWSFLGVALFDLSLPLLFEGLPDPLRIGSAKEFPGAVEAGLFCTGRSGIFLDWIVRIVAVTGLVNMKLILDVISMFISKVVLFFFACANALLCTSKKSVINSGTFFSRVLKNSLRKILSLRFPRVILLNPWGSLFSITDSNGFPFRIPFFSIYPPIACTAFESRLSLRYPGLPPVPPVSLLCISSLSVDAPKIISLLLINFSHYKPFPIDFEIEFATSRPAMLYLRLLATTVCR